MLRSKFIRLFYIMLLGMLVGAVPALAQTEDDGDAQTKTSAPLTAEQLTDPMVAENAITLVFDLYVGGRYQGDVVVTYTDTLLTLHAPEEAVDMFPNVKNPAALLPLLANPIETDRTVPGLGRVHINRALFRVEVFIEPQHLTIQKINITEEDLEPEKKFTLRSDFKVNGTTDFDSDPSRLSVFHRTRPSVGRNHIDWQGIMNRGQGYDLTDLAFAHETGQLTYRAGLLETDGQRFASSREFTGFEVGTTEKTLFNNPLHQGTRLEVFVPESAKVDIFRGEQIIFSRILDFGLQEIDTSRFPGGSYEVDIVITDRNGVETRERRLFTRTRTLTPFNKPRILAQLGVLRDTVDATETPVFQGIYTKRINDFFELGSSLYGSDNISILQGSLKGIYGTAKFEADLSWSTGNDVGLYTQLENDFGWGYTFLSYNRTLTGHDDVGANDPDVFDAIAGQNDTLNFTFNTRIDRSTLTFRANRARNNGNTTYSYGPSLRHPIISGRPHRLDLNLDYLQTNTGNNSGAFLRYSYAPGGRWNYNNTSGLRRTNGNNEFSLTNAAQLNRETGRKTGWSGLLQNNARKSISSESMTTIANAEYINNTAKLNVNSRVTQNPSGQNTESLSLEAYSSVFYADGKLSMAASRGQEGAVLVADITGNAKGQSMRIVANGRTVGVAKVGERVAIYVEPFRTYTFSLQADDKDSLVSFDTAEFIVTLYPGNVTTRQWLVRKAILAFGRLVDVQGNPITWKRIAGAHNTNTLTDGFGYFSLEYSGKETPYIASSSNRCTFAMPHIQSDTEYFTNLGDVVCL